VIVQRLVSEWVRVRQVGFDFPLERYVTLRQLLDQLADPSGDSSEGAVCPECSAVVADLEQHHKWHLNLRQKRLLELRAADVSEKLKGRQP
jgi:hypothetical protein